MDRGIPDHITCLLKNRYGGQEATVRTGHGTTDWFHIGKGVCQGCILSPCLFNLYAEYIIWNARLDNSKAGIKIAGRNINNLRYADHTTLIMESEEELKNLSMKVKEESERADLELSTEKTKIMALGSHHFIANRWGKSENSIRFHFLGLQNQCRQLITAIKLKDTCSLEKSYSKHQFSSFQSLSCVRLRPHGLQHARPLCALPTPRVYSNSCPLSRWCHPAISSSVVPFSFHPQSFPASGSFPVSQFFVSGGQSIGVSASASVLPMNIRDWFSLKLTGLISLLSKGLSRVFPNNTGQKHQFFGTQLCL